jgi:hypothetical protein
MASKISVVSSSESRQPKTWWDGVLEVLDSIGDFEGFEDGNVVYNVALVNRACASPVSEIYPSDFP